MDGRAFHFFVTSMLRNHVIGLALISSSNLDVQVVFKAIFTHVRRGRFMFWRHDTGWQGPC